MSAGSVVGANRSTGCPFLSTKNFVKFHLMPFKPKKPCCFSFKYLYNGMALFPFTLIWVKEKIKTRLGLVIWSISGFDTSYGTEVDFEMGKFVTFAKTSPNSAFCVFKWQTISSPSPSGIWPPNWLHGNANMRNPWMIGIGKINFYSLFKPKLSQRRFLTFVIVILMQLRQFGVVVLRESTLRCNVHNENHKATVFIQFDIVSMRVFHGEIINGAGRFVVNVVTACHFFWFGCAAWFRLRKRKTKMINEYFWLKHMHIREVVGLPSDLMKPLLKISSELKVKMS